MGMTMSTALPPADERAGDILRLRREIGRMQRRRSDDATLPLPAALHDLLPQGGLLTGTVYSVSPSPSLIFALMSSVSQRGSWCAAVGMPTLGLEAAASFGVELSRLILVPDPGDRWLAVVSALAEVVPLICVTPPTRMPDAEAARLAARLRDRGCTLLTTTGATGDAAWPQSEGLITLHDPRWEGLGEGWGLLSDRTVTVTAQTRSSPRPKSLRVRLPDDLGHISAAQDELLTHPKWAVAS